MRPSAEFLQREYFWEFLPERISLSGESIWTTGFEPAVNLYQQLSGHAVEHKRFHLCMAQDAAVEGGATFFVFLRDAVGGVHSNFARGLNFMRESLGAL